MKMAIVTVNYQQAEYLGTCIRSVLNAGGTSVEYAVIDGGSTDDSRSIIQAYSPYMSYWQSRADRGPAAGLNRGFKELEGGILGYINADDYYLPGILTLVERVFSENPGVDVVYGHGLEVGPSGECRRLIYSDRWSPYRFVTGNCNVVQQATFIRRGMFEAVGGFNEDNTTCWDGELLLEISEAGGEFLRCEDVWGAFRIHDESITGSGRLAREYRSAMKRMKRRTFHNDTVQEVFYSIFGPLMKHCSEPRLAARRAMARLK